MRKTVDERIMPEVGDFRLLSRGAVHALRQFREQHRFMRGLIAWLGLKEATVPFKRGARAAGTTKYPTLKMAAFAWTAITSFSGVPLRLGVLAGLFLTLLGVLYFVYAVYRTLVVHATVPGWTSLVFLQIFLSRTHRIARGSRLAVAADAPPGHCPHDKRSHHRRGRKLHRSSVSAK